MEVVHHVIADTSALSYCHQIGLLGVLPSLYRRVLVPEAVVNELLLGLDEGYDVPDPRRFAWMDIRHITSAAHLSVRFPRLDAGELGVLSLALTFPVDTVSVLLDDREARDAAEALGLSHPGVLGVLLAAKRRGLLPTVRPFVERLRATSFRASSQLLLEVLTQAGERD